MALVPPLPRMRCKSYFHHNDSYPFLRIYHSRREKIRRQRIESEQRRRDELRDGYRRLKDALPVSNQKSDKVSPLGRATTHIKYLEMTQQQLQTRQAENEASPSRQCVALLGQTF
jgi:hypothetical protein